MLNWIRQHRTLVWVSLLISAVIYIPALYILPEIKKFNAKLISQVYSNDKERKASIDFDNDGTCETVQIMLISETAYLIVYQAGKILNHWNFTGKYAYKHFIYCNDYDSNSQKEIYLFTHRGDSIFLNVVEPFTGYVALTDFFITAFDRYREKTDFDIVEPSMADLNDDGFSELIIALNCGFSVTARKVITVDILNGTLKQTPKAGLNILSLDPYDINRDGKPEFFCRFTMPGNCPANYPYSDRLGWLAVYKSDLDFLFPPGIIGKEPGMIKICPFIAADSGQIAWYYEYAGNEGDISCIAVSDLKGNLIRKMNIESSIFNYSTFFSSFPRAKPEKLALYFADGKVKIFDKELQLTDQYKGYPSFTEYCQTIDLNLDGNDELIFRDLLRINIFQEDLRHPETIDINPEDVTGIISVIQNHGEKPRFLISGELNDYTFEFCENRLYTLRYFIFPGLFLLFFGFVLTIGYTFHLVAQHRFETERQMARLQITALENQLNPHFNLNVLNSIGSLFENKDTEKAQFYFGKYAKLLRTMLFLSGKIAIPLKEELDFVRNYLDLEKFRMAKPFEYDILVKEEVPDMEIPKMLVHNFAENAVKHGIRHLNKEGKIGIAVKISGKQMMISVSDNGVGREKAREYSSMSTGKGLDLLDETLKLYFTLRHIRITYKIKDLYKDNGEPAGTRADILIPLG